jgi:hypothetical protein
MCYKSKDGLLDICTYRRYSLVCMQEIVHLYGFIPLHVVCVSTSACMRHAAAGQTWHSSTAGRVMTSSGFGRKQRAMRQALQPIIRSALPAPKLTKVLLQGGAMHDGRHGNHGCAT